jgi:hypothetical protein
MENRSIVFLVLCGSFLAAGTVLGQDSRSDLPIRSIFDSPPAQSSAQSVPSFSAGQSPPASDRDPSANPLPALRSQRTGKHRHQLIELTSSNWHPLTRPEKFELFWRDLLQPTTHLSLAGDAAISFATDDRSYLGAGAKGFFSRYGLNVADEANFTFMQAFLFPTLFHEDPRYIPQTVGTKRQRAVYALSRIFVTRRDNGTDGLNRSKLAGTAVAVALSNAYYSPEGRNRSAGANLTRVAISLASDAAFNEFKEFWPDFARKVKLNLWLQNIVRASIRDVIKVD